MKIDICDDDSAITIQISEYIQQFFQDRNLSCPNIHIYNHAQDLLDNASDCDIVFLDIEMPDINGIAAGNEIKQNNPNAIIIVVTAYPDYLDDAMRFQVFRYLSKPIVQTRFNKNMDDALKQYHYHSIQLPIETKDGVHRVPSSDIIFVEAIARKVIIHTTAGDYSSINNMSFWLKILPKNSFVQTHRGYIVNLAHIDSFDHTLISLFHGKYTAYLARRKFTSFKEQFLFYLENN